MAKIDYQKQLNPDQYQAVTHPKGPLLVLAGAGSGKTRALTYRAAYLVDQQGIDPSSILLLTFTNKAAEEMQHRLKSLIHTQLPFAGTFHRFCAKFLRREGKHIGVPPNFLIYDDTDQIDLVKKISKDLNLSPKEFKPRVLLSQIGKAKNELLYPIDYRKLARGYFQETVADVYSRYQDTLEEVGALDFDDLLLKTVKVLSEIKPVHARYSQKFHHVLVDEYQDTNKAQYLIASLIAKNHHNLTAVGDASQSIYRWRGADYRNLEYLSRDFPGLTTIKLEQNYRSTQNILDVAHTIIQKNTSHPVLTLWTDQPSGQPLDLYTATDEKDEARYVINQFQNQPQLSTAVLYRTNAQSRAFEEACIQAGVPYLLIGGVKFYNRKEIKDILAYLRLLAHPHDPVSLDRATKIGKRRLATFRQAAAKLDITSTTTSELFDQVLKATTYLDKFDDKDEQDRSRLENIKELKAVASQFDQLQDFLENVALVENNTQAYDQDHLPTDNHPPSNPLILMTAHSAKGLEFDRVFVVGLEEGIFPHSRSMLEKAELEEERRLCYVALTRARQKLHLTYAQNRLYFGGHQTGVASRFVTEIPEQLLNNHHAPTSTKQHLKISDDILDKFLNDEIDLDTLFDD